MHSWQTLKVHKKTVQLMYEFLVLKQSNKVENSFICRKFRKKFSKKICSHNKNFFHN